MPVLKPSTEQASSLLSKVLPDTGTMQRMHEEAIPRFCSSYQNQPFAFHLQDKWQASGPAKIQEKWTGRETQEFFIKMPALTRQSNRWWDYTDEWDRPYTACSICWIGEKATHRKPQLACSHSRVQPALQSYLFWKTWHIHKIGQANKALFCMVCEQFISEEHYEDNSPTGYSKAQSGWATLSHTRLVLQLLKVYHT